MSGNKKIIQKMFMQENAEYIWWKL